jgi:hypothetical protein
MRTGRSRKRNCCQSKSIVGETERQNSSRTSSNNSKLSHRSESYNPTTSTTVNDVMTSPLPSLPTPPNPTINPRPLPLPIPTNQTVKPTVYTTRDSRAGTGILSTSVTGRPGRKSRFYRANTA